MKFLLLLAVIAAVVVAWKMRAVIAAKILGQDESRVKRHLD
ncbi:hypothetical protein [Nocardioides acrostichi]|nr:hypothetical protein [Nocardioides acrostichi]